MKKGDEVYALYDYDHKSTVQVCRYTITSMGKKQGTAVHTVNGKQIKCRLYAPYNDVYPVSDIEDIDSFALAKAVEQKERWRRHYVNRAHYDLDSTSGYSESMKKECEKLLASKPRVIFR